MNSFLFEDIVNKKDGFLRGPFGGALKKEIFVEKSDSTYKVYEQGVVLNKDNSIGDYYITKDYYDSLMHRFTAKANDILVSCSGVNYGAIYQLPIDSEIGVINQALLRIRLNNDIVDDKYFIYLFENLIVKRITGGTGDSTIPNFPPMNVVRKIPIELPNIDIQQKISKVLSDLDAKIELNNKINADLEAMAKTLYDYWFVQFDFPNKDGRPYKSSGGKMVWSEKLKREIPEGWEIGTISDISELIRGVSYDKKSIKTSNDSNVILILRATNITGNQIDLNDMVYVPCELVNEKQILNKFDILITMSSGSIDHIGKNGFYYFDETVSFGAFCAKFVPKQHYYFYLFNYAQSDFMSNTIKNECLGTNINNLNSGMVNGFKLVIPDGDILKLFNEKVEPLYQKISINYKENQELASLRDWLLPMLMNGQVTVVDINESNNEKKKNVLKSIDIMKGFSSKEENLGMVAEDKVEYKKG